MCIRDSVLPNEAASSDVIVVSSDKFSTYVIAYKDVKKAASMPGGSGSHSTSYAVRFVDVYKRQSLYG